MEPLVSAVRNTLRHSSNSRVILRMQAAEAALWDLARHERKSTNVGQTLLGRSSGNINIIQQEQQQQQHDANINICKCVNILGALQVGLGLSKDGTVTFRPALSQRTCNVQHVEIGEHEPWSCSSGASTTLSRCPTHSQAIFPVVSR